MQIEPIGYFHCRQGRKYESPRQPGYDDNEGAVELLPGQNFEQALIGLDGFRKIWLIFGFHENGHWKPMIRPQNLERKVGVFASRAPYRPNQLGLSCVSLQRVDGLKVCISGHDLLDGTPIYDIKPYHPQADSFSPEQALNDECWYRPAEEFQVTWSAEALGQLAWLESRQVEALGHFVNTQLKFQPFDSSRKRVALLSPGLWSLAYRTWRVIFTLQEERSLRVIGLRSGYSREERLDRSDDRYRDKSLHEEFFKAFGGKKYSADMKGSRYEAVL